MTPAQLRIAREAVIHHEAEAHDAREASYSAPGDRGWWIKKSDMHASFADAIQALIADWGSASE